MSTMEHLLSTTYDEPPIRLLLINCIALEPVGADTRVVMVLRPRGWDNRSIINGLNRSLSSWSKRVRCGIWSAGRRLLVGPCPIEAS